MRDQRESVIKNAEIMRSLYDYSRKLSGASSADDVLWAAAAHLHATFGGRIVLLVAEGDDLQIRAAWPPDAQLDAAALTRRALGPTEERAGRVGHRHAAAASSISSARSSPRAARSPSAASSRIRPTSRSRAEDERALTAILDQTAIALDRALLAREAVKAAAMQENEKVRDALLASLSHDLRTPLSRASPAPRRRCARSATR